MTTRAQTRLRWLLAAVLTVAAVVAIACVKPTAPRVLLVPVVSKPAPRHDQVVMASRTLGTFRCTWYAKGRTVGGGTFTGRYHTMATRSWIPRGSWLLVELDGRRALGYVNDNFGTVWIGKGRKKRRATEAEVRALVDRGVLSFADLSKRMADDLRLTERGHARCKVTILYPGKGVAP